MIKNYLMYLNRIVWGPWTLLLFTFIGIFISLKLNFFQVRFFFDIMRETVGQIFKKRKEKNEEISPLDAVSTALAGTIGTGSITGVAMAIRSGGPGVLFWMFIFSFLGMGIKFCEIFLSLSFREKDEKGKILGGPMFYIEKGLRSKFLSVSFAVFAVFCCFGIGNVTQSNAISFAVENVCGVNRSVCGFFLAIIVLIILFGGIKRISGVNRYIVPFMTVLYTLTAVFILLMRIEKIPNAVNIIFHSAFSLKSVSCGAAGYGFFKGVHYGISRSIFSNEAGLGSAPIAHAASAEKDPAKQGLWGVFEVFFSTIVICSITGLVVLTTDFWRSTSVSGSEIVISAFDLGVPLSGCIVVSFATIFFAFSSILGWAYYGEVCIMYLFKKKYFVWIFRLIYITFVFLGSVFEMEFVWIFSETLNGLMALPNLIAVFLLFEVVKKDCKGLKKKIWKC